MDHTRLVGAVTVVAAAIYTCTADAQDISHRTVRHTTHVDGSGLNVEATYLEAGFARSRTNTPQPTGAGIIWHMAAAGSITESVSVSDTNDETWVGHDLNFERLGYHQTTGDGTPIYEFLFDADPPGNVVVGSAENASLGVVMTSVPSGVFLRAFDDSGPIPLWTYAFPAGSSSFGIRAVDVSADGSMVLASANNSAGGTSTVVAINAATGGVLDSESYTGFTQAVELSDDGSRAVLTQSATARVIETTALTDLHVFAVSGGGGYHRLSRDGTVVAAGGFNLLAYRETAGVWNQIWNESVASNWLGNGIGLSADGNTMFVAQFNYATGYLTLTYRVIDLVGQLETASISTTGTGTLQDTVQEAQASADGQTFAVASWGTANNVHPEVQIFDHDLTLIGSIDTPGSPFSLDMSADGQYVVAGAKAIHANISGNGSDTYAYRIFASPCTWDCSTPADGVIDIGDLLALLAGWGGPGDCDFDGGSIAIADLLALLANWGPCP